MFGGASLWPHRPKLMVFNSYTFILFFAVIVGAMRLDIAWRPKKTILLLGSYLFYAAWNPPFVLLLWMSTIVDWWICKGIAATESTKRKRAFVGLSLLTNLGLLGYFKYGEFLVRNFITLLSNVGVAYQPPEFDIILPVGISFYTFQTLSYTLDVYKRNMRPWNSFLDYALYVTFFPQLVAGPIVRAAEFLPQTATQPAVTSSRVGWGLSLMTLGLFQKVVLADGLLAPVVEQVYDSVGSPSALASGVGTLGFAGQIFCDFSGYSTIAIGAAMVLGFSLPDNFRFPYAAIGFSDFWGRWHITLSTWLRDYLYISLGGNRRGMANTYRNLGLTMLLGGLWHGASWNFVVWGGLHGLYLVAERLLVRATGSWRIWRTLLGRVALWGLTFGLVCFAWIFFRAPTWDRSIEVISGLLFIGSPNVYVSHADFLIVTCVVGCLLLAHAFFRGKSLEEVAAQVPRWLRPAVLGVMLFAVFNSPGEDRAFIYFQF